jgi:hypothetical protein
LSKAAELLGIEFSYQLKDLKEITGANRGGKDNVNFIKEHGRVIGARPKNAPILVLYDWEAKEGDISTMTSLLSSLHDQSKAFKMDATDANPELSDDFRGIERFLTTDFIKRAEDNGLLTLSFSEKQRTYYLTNKKVYSENKTRICQLFEKTAVQDDCIYLKKVLFQIHRILYDPQGTLL